MFWRRRFPRLSKDFQITYRMVDQEKFDHDPIKSLALNISGGGVCFEATDNLQKGTLVALDIRSDDFNAPILALAKVVWCKPMGPGTRLAQSSGGLAGGMIKPKRPLPIMLRPRLPLRARLCSDNAGFQPLSETLAAAEGARPAHERRRNRRRKNAGTSKFRSSGTLSGSRGGALLLNACQRA